MSLTATQRALVAEFRDMTNCNDATAQKYLKSTRFNIESALDTYLRKHSGGNQTSKADLKLLNDLFDKYMAIAGDTEQADMSEKRKATKSGGGAIAKDDDVMQIDGAMQFLVDVGLDLEKAPVLAVCMQLGAPTQGQFKRKPWVEGWRSLNIFKLPAMKTYAASLEQTLSHGSAQYDEALFKRTYLFTYGFALTPPARTLDLDSALAFWDVLFTSTGYPFKLYPEWRAFCEAKTRGVSRDVWNMLYDFSQVVAPDLSDYDEMEAWPVLIDDFVAHCKEQK